MTDVINILKSLGYSTVPASFYSNIAVWKSWYDGNVRIFHRYQVYNGLSRVDCCRYTMGMAKKVAEDWANLLLNEKVKITLEGNAEQEFFDSVCKANNFSVKSNEMQELKAALGTAAYVVRASGMDVDRNTGKISSRDGATLKIDYVTAPNIFPLSWENGIVRECAFSGIVMEGGKEYTYLQIHRKGEDGNYIIENRLYQNSTEAELSTVKSMVNVPPVVHTNSPMPQFVIDRLNIANNVDNTLPMGIPAFANAIDQLKGVDVAYDSYVNEFVLGKKRVMLKPGAVKDLNGNPVFDPNELYYYVLPEDTADGNIIQPIDMTLRTTEHNAGLQDRRQHTMYDYMQALQEKFFSDDLYAKQRQEIETIRCKLSHTLDKQQRKQLLQLVDAESQLRDGMALDSFIAGFRLACGIGSELGRSNWYSYVENEEQRLSEAFDERRDP